MESVLQNRELEQECEEQLCGIAYIKFCHILAEPMHAFCGESAISNEVCVVSTSRVPPVRYSLLLLFSSKVLLANSLRRMEKIILAICFHSRPISVPCLTGSTCGLKPPTRCVISGLPRQHEPDPCTAELLRCPRLPHRAKTNPHPVWTRSRRWRSFTYHLLFTHCGRTAP